MKLGSGKAEGCPEFTLFAATPLGLFGLTRLAFDRFFRRWQTTSITENQILQVRQGRELEYRMIVVKDGRILKIIPTTAPPTLPPFKILI